MPGKDVEVDAVLAIEGRCINHLVVATRRSTSAIKVSGRMRSDEFKRTLGFSFTVII